MSKTGDDFFEGKRPWSRIKDRILGSYIRPYLAKVRGLGRPILLIDGYAGPGVFDDGTSGSPMILCSAANELVPGRYKAIFINKEKVYHIKLKSVLERANYLGPAEPILGDSTKLLQTMATALTNETVFLYLDPFGLIGCKFSLLEPFLQRSANVSTELMLTLSMPIVHRLSARIPTVSVQTPFLNLDDYGISKRKRRSATESISSLHQTMTDVFGGDYWQDIMWQPNMKSEDCEMQLMAAYKAKLAEYLPYVGFCPVRERLDRRIKYFVVFASHHPDAMVKLNDIMANAYFDGLTEGNFPSTAWRELRPTQDLDDVILNCVAQYPGERREEIWSRIVQTHFMRYLESEYRKSTQHLVEQGRLSCPTPRKTRRLNDSCVLYPGTTDTK